MENTIYRFEVRMTKTFVKGALKGLSIRDSLGFVTRSAAEDWIKAVSAKKTLDYRLSETAILSS